MKSLSDIMNSDMSASKDEGQEPDESYSDDLKSAMTDFIDAVHAKDPEAACKAFDQVLEFSKEGQSKEDEGDAGQPGHALVIIGKK